MNCEKENYFGIRPFGALPSRRQLAHYEMGMKAMLCFGMNTYTDFEWGSGTENEKLVNPTNMDVKGWVRDIKSAGYKLIILTAKHHDGFCLWPSQYSEHTIAKSPYQDGKGDIVKEFTDACHAYHVGVGLYLSPWDRNSKYWGTDEYNTYYASQLTELLTNYGRVDEIWWDGAGSSEAHYDFGRWAYLIRDLQPNAVIFGTMGAEPYIEARWVGNEAGHAGETHYASIAKESIRTENTTDINIGKIGADRYIPAEVDVSIRPGWFYHQDQDDQVKDSRLIDEIWFRSVANNALMLLSFAPDKTGNIPRKDIREAVLSHHRISRMLSVNFLDAADVRADSQYSEETGIAGALMPDKDFFYASAEGTTQAVIDMTIEDGSSFNTLLLGEKVELGERITSFRLECLDEGKPKELVSGTSVGYLRGKRFPSGAYRHLRLTLSGIAAPLTLRTLGLYDYEEMPASANPVTEKRNLLHCAAAKIENSEDKRSAVLSFGGIYPFENISFTTEKGSAYKIEAFDGFKFYSIAEGTAKENRVSVRLAQPIDTAYQIRISAEKGFAFDPYFSVV